MQKTEGLGEGGMLGPLEYPLVPAVLSGALEKSGAGIGVAPPVDASAALRGADPLNREEGWKFEELDRGAEWRFPILLQADDQALPASNLASLDDMVRIAEEWSISVHQEFHVGLDKTVVLLIGLQVPGASGPEGPRIYGHPLGFTSQHKWLGVIWDSWLTFEPNLERQIGAARAAFRPILALARDGLAPLAEIRELIESKVKGALFFAPAFLFMAQDAVGKLDALQEEFERAIIGAAPKVPGRAALRAEMGSPLTWGEELILRVVGMRAELWTLEENMLAKKVWRNSQSFKGNTFAAASRSLLDELALPEIWEVPGWSDAEPDRRIGRGGLQEKDQGGAGGAQRDRVARKSSPGVPRAPVPGGLTCATLGCRHHARGR